MKKNVSLFGLPQEIKFCSKCVISNQRPSSTVEFRSRLNNKKKGIKIDDLGVCSACQYHELKSKIDWKKREVMLEKLLSKYRKKSGYDVVVPSSGGKDSGMTAHLLKYKYGMNPLTVTWSPHKFTDIGWQNFTNCINVGGFDNILFSPNGRLHRTLTSLAFKNILHPFQPFIIGQKIIGPLIAARFNIPLVIYGENPAEDGNLIEDNYKPEMDYDFFSIQDIKKILLGAVPINKIIKKYKFNLNDFAPYIPPTKKEIIEKKIKVHYLGYYVKWDPQESFYYAAKHTGFRPNTERTSGTYSKYSSIDDKIDDFHWFTTFIKFGIGRATYDSYQEIRNEKITREEGINLVKKFDAEFPKRYFKEFLDYIDISEKDFWKTIDKFRSPHLWKKVKKKWILKHQIK
jgi:N-acetyl sugar amidotransferase